MKPRSVILPPLDWPLIRPFGALARACSHSRHIHSGDVFFAFPGIKHDGRTFIEEALSRGAAAVLWEAEQFVWNPAWPTPNLGIKQLDAQTGLIVSQWLGHPSQHMHLIATTGTNGKTSVTQWLGEALTTLGFRAGILGTLGNGLYGHTTPAALTTVEATQLHDQLAQLRTQNASHVVMEASSHGLSQARLHGAAFKTAVFTNLSQDHLDYHGSVTRYATAKRRLFEWESLDAAVINADDDFGYTLLHHSTAPTVLSYGVQRGTLRATQVYSNAEGLRFAVETPYGHTPIHSPRIFGRFNAYNLLAVIGVLLTLGIPLKDAAAVLARLHPIAGRMQKLGGGQDPIVVIDYAHTPDALEKTLSALKETLGTSSHLWCVFGCGGGRDREKRPLMGGIASRLADHVIITSDNPRHESAKKIADDIQSGVERPCQLEMERQSAIRQAVLDANPGDTILIAGKGHETYQDIQGVRYPFDDVKHAQMALALRQNRHV